MKKIGGNVVAEFQKLVVSRNKIGEEVKAWQTVATHKGFLDLSSGTSSYLGQNAKTVDSTHVFICDVFDIDVKSVSRMVIGKRTFDVTYFDEPMELGYHYEVFLKETEQYGN